MAEPATGVAQDHTRCKGKLACAEADGLLSLHLYKFNLREAMRLCFARLCKIGPRPLQSVARTACQDLSPGTEVQASRVESMQITRQLASSAFARSKGGVFSPATTLRL